MNWFKRLWHHYCATYYAVACDHLHDSGRSTSDDFREAFDKLQHHRLKLDNEENAVSK